MSELVMINKRHESMNGQYACLFDDGKMDQLINVIKSDVGGKIEDLSTEIKHLNDQQRDIHRWVLAVVCILALGKGAIDIIEKVWGETSKAVAVSQPATDYIKP